MPRLILACIAWLLAVPALAQNFPSRPIKIIVPFAPGASSDASARALAQQLGPLLGQSIIVENMGGGGGVTGVQAMARAEPDGHTLALGAAGGMVIIPLMPNAPANWDPANDVQPVARLVDVPLVIVANPASGLTSLADVIAKAKATPEGLTYGSTGTNSGMHLAIEYLSFKTKAKLVHVPYRGSAPAIMDAVAGQVPFVSVDLTSALPQIRAGKVVGLAMISAQRVSFAPEVPSLGELGYPGYEGQAFLGLFAPKGTPTAVLERLNTHVKAIVNGPQFGKHMQNVALVPSFLDAPAFGKFLQEDRARWRDALKAIGKLKP
jgi:tripartite-type tricarboxylate transporter receptor subunit TctC